MSGVIYNLTFTVKPTVLCLMITIFLLMLSGEELFAQQRGTISVDPTSPTPPRALPPTAGGKVLQQDDGVLQQQSAQQPADDGTGTTAPPICAPGSVFDPDINECVLENSPELCPDGSTSQPTVPAGTQPKCPPSGTEQPSAEMLE